MISEYENMLRLRPNTQNPLVISMVAEPVQNHGDDATGKERRKIIMPEWLEVDRHFVERPIPKYKVKS